MKVSFDFDDTLTKPFYDENVTRSGGWWLSSYEPREFVLSMLLTLHSEGHEIIILTSRYEDNKERIQEFIDEHGLPISEIVCTNGDDAKWKYIESHNVDLHFDDHPPTIQTATARQLGAVLIVHPFTALWDYDEDELGFTCIS